MAASVAAQGSLSAAARALGLTPSAVSRILANLAEVEGSIADQAFPRGRLRVTASLAHGRLFVVPLLGDFTARYPGILVDLNLSDRIVDVLAGQADVAIRFGQLADSPLTARKLGVTGRVVVASPAYLERHGTPQVPDDLLAHNCLSFNFRRAEPGWPFRKAGRDRALAVAGSIEANNGESFALLRALASASRESGGSRCGTTLPQANWCRCWRRTTRRIASPSMPCSSAVRPCRRGCAYSSTFWPGDLVLVGAG